MLLLLFLDTAMIASYKGGYGQDAFGVTSTGASALLPITRKIGARWGPVVVVVLLFLFALGFAFRFD